MTKAPGNGPTTGYELRHDIDQRQLRELRATVAYLNAELAKRDKRIFELECANAGLQYEAEEYKAELETLRTLAIQVHAGEWDVQP